MMDWKTFVTLAVTIGIAVAGYANTIRLARRKDRLDRINRQLKELYGPLRTISAATEQIWLAFGRKYQIGEGYWGGKSISDYGDIWRVWLERVFMPLNLEMVEAITHGADLIDEPRTPQCFLDLCAHVASYQAVLERWRQGDVTEYHSVVGFPTDLKTHVEERFNYLKAQQIRYLGRRTSGTEITKETQVLL
jgi:hypothetical protein